MSHGTAERSVRHTIMAIATVLLLCGATACGLGEYPRVGLRAGQRVRPTHRESFATRSFHSHLNDIHFGRLDSGCTVPTKF